MEDLTNKDQICEAVESFAVNAYRGFALPSVQVNIIMARIIRPNHPYFDVMRGVQTDAVMRSSVLFLHAMVECVVRSIAEILLPQSGNLEGLKLKRQTYKNIQAALSDEFKELPAAEIEILAKKELLENFSATSSSGVIRLLRNVGINPSELEQYLKLLDELMDRRHRIIHFADRPITDGSVRDLYTSLHSWCLNAVDFCATAFVLALRYLEEDSFKNEREKLCQ